MSSLAQARAEYSRKQNKKASTAPRDRCVKLQQQLEKTAKQLAEIQKANEAKKKDAQKLLEARQKKEHDKLEAKHKKELDSLTERFGCTPKPKKPRKARAPKAEGAANDAPAKTAAKKTPRAKKANKKKASSKKADQAGPERSPRPAPAADARPTAAARTAPKYQRLVESKLLPATKLRDAQTPDEAYWLAAAAGLDYDLDAGWFRRDQPRSTPLVLPGPAGPVMLSWPELADRFPLANGTSDVLQQAEAAGWRFNVLAGALGDAREHVEVDAAADIGATGVQQLLAQGIEHNARGAASRLIYATNKRIRLPSPSREGRHSAVAAALSATQRVYGDATTVAVQPARGAVWGLPARYVLLRARDLVPSHDAHGFAPRPDYPPPPMQERNYQDEVERRKVEALTDLPQLLPAAPVIAAGPAAIVLGGNGRTLAAQRHYLANRTELRKYLRDHASDFGFTAAQVDRFDDPMVAREVDVPMSQWYRLVRALNTKPAQTALFKG